MTFHQGAAALVVQVPSRRGRTCTAGRRATPPDGDPSASSTHRLATPNAAARAVHITHAATAAALLHPPFQCYGAMAAEAVGTAEGGSGMGARRRQSGTER